MPLPYPKLLLLLSFVMDGEAPVTIVLMICALILVRGGRELIICRLLPYLEGPAGCGTLSLSLVIPSLHPRFISSRWHAAFLCTLYRVIIFPPLYTCSPASLARTIIDPGCVLGKGQKIEP